MGTTLKPPFGPPPPAPVVVMTAGTVIVVLAFEGFTVNTDGNVRAADDAPAAVHEEEGEEG